MILVLGSGIMNTLVANTLEAAGRPRASIRIFVPVQANWLVLILAL